MLKTEILKHIVKCFLYSLKRKILAYFIKIIFIFTKKVIIFTLKQEYFYDDDDDNDDELYCGMIDRQKTFSFISSRDPLSEILTTVNLQNTASRV